MTQTRRGKGDRRINNFKKKNDCVFRKLKLVAKAKLYFNLIRKEKKQSVDFVLQMAMREALRIVLYASCVYRYTYARICRARGLLRAKNI